jgi:hypothetical protein
MEEHCSNDDRTDREPNQESLIFRVSQEGIEIWGVPLRYNISPPWHPSGKMN